MLVVARVDVGLIHEIAAAPALGGDRFHLAQRAGQVRRQQAGNFHDLGAVVGVDALQVFAPKPGIPGCAAVDDHAFRPKAFRNSGSNSRKAAIVNMASTRSARSRFAAWASWLRLLPTLPSCPKAFASNSRSIGARRVLRVLGGVPRLWIR